jgi:hypothetical protein
LSDMRGNSKIIGPLQETSDTDAIGIFDTFDQFNSNRLDEWPITAYPTNGTITPNTTSASENGSVVFTVSVNNWFTGTMYWSVTNTSMTSEDFAGGATSGSFSVTDGSGEFSIGLVGDGIAEGDTFQVELRRDSTSGLLFDTTATISVADGDIPTGEDIRSSFYAISEYQNNDGQNDTTANYSVSEVQQDYSGTGRLYLIHKATGAVTYYNDVPIACIQVLDSAGSTVNEQWWFGTSGNGRGWTTATVEYNIGAIGSGITITPAQAAANYTYPNSVVNCASADRFCLASSTGSVTTGAVDGIAEPSGPMTVGEETMAQSLNTYYMYRETSGAQVGYCSLCRSPSRTWSAGEIIRIAYIIGNVATANYFDEDDTLFVGIA